MVLFITLQHHQKHIKRKTVIENSISVRCRQAWYKIALTACPYFPRVIPSPRQQQNQLNLIRNLKRVNIFLFTGRVLHAESFRWRVLFAFHLMTMRSVECSIEKVGNWLRLVRNIFIMDSIPKNQSFMSKLKKFQLHRAFKSNSTEYSTRF